MNLVHLVPQIEEQSSGYAYTVPRTCEALCVAGHSVSLITVDGCTTKFDFDSLSDQRKERTTREMAQIQGTKRLEKQLGISCKLKSAVYKAASKCDILHAHSLWRMTNIYPAWAAKKNSIPFVVSPRGTLSQWANSEHSLTKNFFNYFVQKRALESASLIHATSHEEYLDIRRIGLNAPVAIIPNGVDIPIIENHELNPRKTILYVGRIHQIKGLELLLDCWGTLERSFPDWQIKIVGPIDSEYAIGLKNFTAQKSMERIEFVGEKLGVELTKEYQQANILVLPSYSENFGMVVAEALANATPVITTTGTPWSKTEEKRCGWWIERNKDVFQSTMQEAMSMKASELQMMGTRGHRWMAEDYSWEKVAQDLTNAYNWLHQNAQCPDYVMVK